MQPIPTSYTEASVLDLHVTISNDIVSTKMNDDLDFELVINFPFYDDNVPRFTSQLIRFARAAMLQT